MIYEKNVRIWRVICFGIATPYRKSLCIQGGWEASVPQGEQLDGFMRKGNERHMREISLGCGRMCIGWNESVTRIVALNG